MHKPVLLDEVIEYLNPKPGENFIDCTIGEAGHALAIFERIKPTGKLLGIDTDSEAIKRIKTQDRLILIHGNFKDLKKIVEEEVFQPISGILFDIGLSSWQIEKSGRGFSFKKDEPLKMTFNNQNLTAEEIINKWPEEALREVFTKYGEEKYSRRIAKQIIEERKGRDIKTTFQLKKTIERAIPFSGARPAYWSASQRGERGKRGRIDRVLARIFQALRIVVNDELENLKQGVEQALEILKPRGRLVVISFHSLEDRIVKNFFKEKGKDELLKILTKKPVTASQEELKSNPRSRSAKLRAAEKL